MDWLRIPLYFMLSTCVLALPPLSDSVVRLHSPAHGPEDRLPTGDKAKIQWECLECELGVALLQSELSSGTPYDVLVQEGIDLCISPIGMTELFCYGYVPQVAPILYYIFTNNNVSAADFCGMALSYWGCTTNNPDREWSVTIHGDKPPLQTISLPETDAPKLKVLHIADTHMDPLYSPGSNANCPEELCCREESGLPETPDDAAWYWGDYRHCGSPPWMLEDMLAHVRSEHPDLDYVIWTGDVVPHNMWSTSREWNLRMVRETNEMVLKWFPDVAVFPVVGNHEMSPLDQYPIPDAVPSDLAADWLYEELASQWAKVIPDFDNSTVLHAGFYNVLVKPGFRVISFNTMFGYTPNVWLVQDSQDPAGVLTWLEDQLFRAESAGELVHLLGHVPPGILATERTWSREYNRIVLRYENIIRGQFFGHTHYDEFEIFHDGDRPIGVAYVAPSQTPWYDLNPAYRIYHVDGDRSDTTRLVLDHETYIMNLTEAHLTGEARWYQLYSAKDLYGMASLLPEERQQLATRMAEDRDLFDLYYRNYVSGGEPYLSLGCDDICYQQRLCDMVTSNRNDLDSCVQILSVLKSVQDGVL